MIHPKIIIPTSLLALMLLLCCALNVSAQGPANTKEMRLDLRPLFGEQDLILNRQYINENGDTLEIERFRFYLSGFELTYANGSVYRETESYHLIDASEDSTLHLALKNVPEGKITSLRFNIGVDSLKSVSGAFGGDLDPMYGMYWAWNSGYIHAKLEGKSNACPTHGHQFEFHIGGFSGKQNALRPVKIDLPENMGNHRKLTIMANAGAWLEGVSLAATNSIVIPGDAAMQMADRYAGMFKLVTVNEK